jgi:hypothetical protein
LVAYRLVIDTELVALRGAGCVAPISGDGAGVAATGA